MSFDAGPVVSTIGNLAAVGIVAGVAQGVARNVSQSYRSNQRTHKVHSGHKEHMFSMQHHSHKSSGKKKGSYSIWEGTGF